MLHGPSLKEQGRPTFLFNDSGLTDDSDEGYLHVPTQLLPRACLPAELQDRGCALQASGDEDTLLRSALWHGIFLTRAQIKSVMGVVKCPKIPPRTGSGKNRLVVKADDVKQLLQHLFPTAADADFDRMFKALTLQNPKPWSDQEEAVTHMVSCLDEENGAEYMPMAKKCRKRLDQKLREEGKRANMDEVAQAAREHMKEEKAKPEEEIKLLRSRAGPSQPPPGSLPGTVRVETKPRQPRTPADWKTLLPGRGTVTGVFYGKHDNVKCYFRVEYACASVTVHSSFFTSRKP